MIARTIFLSAILFNMAAVNPNDLIKVTNDNKQSCVEYYTYQGEMYCSTKALHANKIDPEIKNDERQTIAFDNRPWQATWGKKTDKIVTIEYVTMGDDIDNWHELITSQFFPGIQNKLTPKKFAEVEMGSLKSAGFTPIVTLISDTPNEVMFEYRIESPDSEIQDELQKITKGKDGIYVLHYVIKKKDMGDDARKMWVKNLSESKLK